MNSNLNNVFFFSIFEVDNDDDVASGPGETTTIKATGDNNPCDESANSSQPQKECWREANNFIKCLECETGGCCKCRYTLEFFLIDFLGLRYGFGQEN